MTWEYSLAADTVTDMSVPPQGCPPGRVTAPRLGDAANLVDIPGGLIYTTGSDVTQAVDFYQSQMPAAGYQISGTAMVASDFARLEYTRGVWMTVIYITAGPPTEVDIRLVNTLAAASATPGPPVPTVSHEGNPSVAFSRMLRAGDPPDALPSYHVDLHHTFPERNPSSGLMVMTDYQAAADLHAENIYLKRTVSSPPKAPQTLEGYLIDGKEYSVVQGNAVEGDAGISLEWAMWPLDAMPAIGAASLGYTLQGTDVIEGRIVDVVDMDTSKADPAQMQAWRSLDIFSTVVTEAHGTAWVDQQTGVLLKIILDYTAEVHDPASKNLLGTGAGRLEITVSKIGLTVVQLP
jgi:hypothetical protein